MAAARGAVGAVAPRPDWSLMYNRFYAKKEVYEMQWGDEMDLRRYMVVAGSFGGPIALIRDPKKLLVLGGLMSQNDEEMINPVLRIYTSAGRLISSTPWDNKAGGLVKMAWTDSETLVCALDNGTVFVYSIHGERLASFDVFSLLGSEYKALGVADMVVWGAGLVIRTAADQATGRFELIAVDDISDPYPEKLASNNLSSPPASMAVIAPHFTESRRVEVLLATADRSIVVVDHKEAQDQALESGPFTQMRVSPSGTLVACFNSEGALFIFSTDFTKNFSKFSTSSKNSPLDVAWCADDSVVLYWNKIFLMVGPYGDYAKYQYDGPLVLVPECDGLRIISNECCEFLYRVPESTEEILKPASNVPSTLLFDAAEAFEHGDAKADEHIRAIIEDAGEDRSHVLEEAIDKCLDAASHELDVKTQRQMLQAASYGALFCENWDSERFVETCQILRILNAVRYQDVGIPLTYTQYKRLGAEVLVGRLINRHHHLLALRVCEYLRMTDVQERVLIHWACAKIRLAEDEDDESLGDAIIDRLDSYGDISYSEIANTAFKYGRKQLATMLLECESRAADQVPLLIRMGNDALALEKAVDSSDTDLIYLVLLHIKRTKTEDELWQAIQSFPVARNLMVVYCKEYDHALLKSYYFHFQMVKELADLAAIEAYVDIDWNQRMQGLEIAQRFYSKDKALQFNAQVTSDEIRLLKQQRELELQLPNETFVDQPLAELMENYIAHGQAKAAQKLKQEYRMDDKCFTHIHVRTYARLQAWEALEKLAVKKCPIGMQYFIGACLDHGAQREAIKYVHKLPDHTEKLEWLTRLGEWDEAVEVAVRAKDTEALEQIRDICRQPRVQQQIEKILRGGK